MTLCMNPVLELWQPFETVAIFIPKWGNWSSKKYSHLDNLWQNQNANLEQPQSETFTDLLCWKVSSTCSDKSYGIHSDSLFVFKMEIPTGKPQPLPRPGEVCFLWRQLQKEKRAVSFWFLITIAFGFSGSWQDAGMPEGQKWRHVKSLRWSNKWPKELRMQGTPSSRIMVLNWEWLCPLGNIVAMSRDTSELSQRGRGCYWHLVGWSQRYC